jgi:ATP-dependent DNA helicase 2 subunit 2
LIYKLTLDLVPAKQKGRKRHREMEKPVSGLDIEGLLGTAKRPKSISSQNAIPEFKQALAASDDMGLVKAAAEQMGAIIQEYINSSVGDSSYNKAVEALRVMRDELVELEEPEMYNEFITRLKKALLDGKLGGDRKEMWWKVRVARLGLVDKTLSEVSKVTEEQAKDFYKAS